MPKLILKLEGLAILVTAIYMYHLSGASWVLFALLILVPDISMIGYLKDTKLGAITYNLMHNYVLAIILLMAGVVMKNVTLVSLGLILAAHIGMDRFLGFGLKYPTNFKDTHLQKV
ncbi:MAG: DUF4260 domain-containing protein [Patescibacteria group bacterium]